ncbi:MAG: hypothetical protein GSR84_07895 [Desulfurococcales archaeon]|nr:hypothetical protein [Desulfurococcales archaeon]
MRVKASNATSYKIVKLVDGMADYITIPVSGGSGARAVPLGSARDLASIASRSTPVLSVRRSTIPWAVDAARKLDFEVLEYTVPVPSVSAAILAEMIRQYGIRLGTVIVWDGRWIPEKPINYVNSITTLASNIEYILIESRRQETPFSDLKGYDRYGINYEALGGEVCRVAEDGNIDLIDIDAAQIPESQLQSTITRIKGCRE